MRRAEGARTRLRADGLGRLPRKLSFIASGPGPDWAGWLSDGQRDLPLADIKAVYWRRPTNFRLPVHLSERQRRFAVAEARQGMGGLISCLPVPFVNHPSRIAEAELKPTRLRAAIEAGFVVPPTLITSSGVEARQFATRFGTVLYKPLTSAFLYEDDQVKLVYATLIEAGDIDDDSIALSPCQFEAFIPKSQDIRLVAVERECFAVAIHAGSDKSYVDWRADYPALSYEAVETPSGIADAIARRLAGDAA
ncbi:MAG: ATP-dependent carboxylate-amine ligase [Actinomycetota bacterium]|nr:ATP-dependent carboxylate-amine ligase [Actinomycetota bacterium]